MRSKILTTLLSIIGVTGAAVAISGGYKYLKNPSEKKAEDDTAASTDNSSELVELEKWMRSEFIRVQGLETENGIVFKLLGKLAYIRHEVAALHHKYFYVVFNLNEANDEIVSIKDHGVYDKADSIVDAAMYVVKLINNWMLIENNCYNGVCIESFVKWDPVINDWIGEHVYEHPGSIKKKPLKESGKSGVTPIEEEENGDDTDDYTEVREDFVSC